MIEAIRAKLAERSPETTVEGSLRKCKELYWGYFKSPCEGAELGKLVKEFHALVDPHIIGTQLEELIAFREKHVWARLVKPWSKMILGETLH